MADLNSIGGIHYDIMRRCYNKKSVTYKDYGAKGITVCEEWQGIEGFFAFYRWFMDNGYREDLSIDRINNDGNYEPLNCRWATAKEQSNNRRNTKLYQYKGKLLSLAEISRSENVNYGLLYLRVSKKKMKIEDAIKEIKK